MDQKKADDEREKLRQHFSKLSDAEQVKGWDDMWQKEVTPWDRSEPNPALVDTLSDKTDISGSPWKQGKDDAAGRKKVLVPGCGRGYDVQLFASYGFDAYGVDGSSTAVAAAQKLAQDPDKMQQFPVKNSQAGRGSAKVLEGDFFGDHWLKATGISQDDGPFDLIYDYTFLCALPPSLRPRWAARMSELLAPGGTLICLEFPLGKDPKLGGPPHGLTHELYEQLFEKPGGKTDNALARQDAWHPKRSFPGQEAATMVSLWKHRHQ